MQNGTKGNNKEGSGGKFPTVIGLPGGNDGRTVGLTNGARIALEEARAFMDYYCSFHFILSAPEALVIFPVFPL